MPKKHSTPTRVSRSVPPCLRRRLDVVVLTRAGRLSRKLTADDLCQLIPISRATAYAYVSGARPVPPAIMELIQIKALGLIPDPAFDGYRVVDGVLWTDTDAHFDLAALNDFRRVYQMNREYRQELYPPRIEKEVRSVTSVIECDSSAIECDKVR